MRPHHRPLLEKTPLVLRAHFGSSRVREDLPRRVREVGRSGLAPRIVRPPPPTPALYAGHAACDAVDGSETSVLLEPRSTAYDLTVLLESKSINRFLMKGTRWFPPRRPTVSPRERGVAPAGPRSPADLATLAPARDQVAAPGNLGGKSLPTADLPNDAAGESAARVDSLADSPKRTRIRAIRKIQRWGVRGAPYHPLRWS